MYSGGESPKTVVGAVRDTAGPKFYFKAKSKDKEKTKNAAKASGDSCEIVYEDPLIKICDGKVIAGQGALKYFSRK